MLTNYDLEDLSSYYNVPIVDICMKDQLPKTCKDGNYIINLQSSTEGNGTHFTALIVKGKSAFFFDSFGAPPSLEIRDFVKNKVDYFGFNNWVIQDLKSENCGYFCFSFLLYVNPDQLFTSANRYINRFIDDTSMNDDILKDSFRNLPLKPPPLIQRLFKIKAKKWKVGKWVLKSTFSPLRGPS